MRTLIVGFGRSGAGLHLPVLRRLRAEAGAADHWSPEPPLVWDVRDVRQEAAAAGLAAAGSLEEAAATADPARTVVHVCTPPMERPHVLEQLADLGFTRLLVEKPLAADTASLEAVDALARKRGLILRVISPWLSSELTGALRRLAGGPRLGALRSLAFRQLKPRWTRSLNGPGHPTVFDVELPHSVGVALRLAGDAQPVRAAWEDLRLGGRTVPRMGRGHLELRHENGTTSEFFTDLTAPVRERSVVMRCATGEVTGHYPVSEADHHAQWTVREGAGAARRSVVHDEALATFLRDAYRDFAEGRTTARGADDYAIGRRVVEILQEAKSLAEASPTARVPDPGERPAEPVDLSKGAAHDV
ncbi:Gfo/Idh/MocA family oxidoreductase [Streptomyces sp. TP-A0874]|uniref:Gfo/Idh/MocA family oxidoreductase n=1 Tax=Streptomyces sp. TP-A0874 TaxID=549819 RepID=UPI000852BAF6|nr:Gfo/Idh/MocA family oxidoreductase [Streptomyces sp. TP-A0874]